MEEIHVINFAGHIFAKQKMRVVVKICFNANSTAKWTIFYLYCTAIEFSTSLNIQKRKECTVVYLLSCDMKIKITFLNKQVRKVRTYKNHILSGCKNLLKGYEIYFLIFISWIEVSFPQSSALLNGFLIPAEMKKKCIKVHLTSSWHGLSIYCCFYRQSN